LNYKCNEHSLPIFPCIAHNLAKHTLSLTVTHYEHMPLNMFSFANT